MYESFYNLKRGPFEITPDPSFLFSTKRHNEALAALYYGVRWRKGFVVLTGQVGTGKTLLLRCLLQLLKQSKDVAYAYVFSSRLTPTEFLQYILNDFGLPTAGKNKGELLFDLCNFVVNRGLKGLTTVLIVDEAHHLSAEALEEVRLLTNLETAEHKLLQIVLVGQPELDDKLDSAKLTQLKQRIAIRSHLEPLDHEDTRGYIDSRLRLVGNQSAGGNSVSPRDGCGGVSPLARYSAPDQYHLRERAAIVLCQADIERDAGNHRRSGSRLSAQRGASLGS